MAVRQTIGEAVIMIYCGHLTHCGFAIFAIIMFVHADLPPRSGFACKIVVNAHFIQVKVNCVFFIDKISTLQICKHVCPHAAYAVLWSVTCALSCQPVKNAHKSSKSKAALVFEVHVTAYTMLLKGQDAYCCKCNHFSASVQTAAKGCLMPAVFTLC